MFINLRKEQTMSALIVWAAAGFAGCAAVLLGVAVTGRAIAEIRKSWAARERPRNS